MADDVDLDELRAELDDFAQPERQGGRSAREERILAGFEEIRRFVAQHGRVPNHGEGIDIFERLYAARLERLRKLEECRTLLAPLDHQGLLATVVPYASVKIMDDDELLDELRGAAGSGEIMQLRHVRTTAEKRAAEEIETREPCPDFEKFAPLFEAVQRDLKSGVRKLRPFETRSMAEVSEGAFFVVGGQTAYVAEVGEEFTTQYDRRDRRLRVIYDNGTESKALLRSQLRALHRDAAARYVTNPDSGPLFAEKVEPEDLASGKIYVLRSKSELPEIAARRDVLHKVGVTGGKVEARIANAKFDPTFLMADVDVVASYDLYNVNRVTLENVIHRVLDPARLDIEIKDRFGKPVRPREWFLVPLFVVDEVVERIKDGSITGYVYDPKAAKLIKAVGP
ncbi:MAG TPA: GIY-YIG nuclease family protein [Polyangiaceae bacterium]|jgi:hypothetical protein